MTYLSESENKLFEGDGSCNQDGKNLKEFLEEYDPFHYKNPSSTVDTAVFTFSGNEDKLKVLLVKRKNHPSIGQWAIPGGFVDYKEDIFKAAKRELEEETSIKDINPVQLRTYGEPGRDPRTRIITTLYVALVPEDSICPKAGDDAAEAALFETELKEISDGYYKLFLDNEEKNLHLSADLKKEVITGGIIPVVKYTMTGSDGVALDHGVLIADAYDFIINTKYRYN